jgi:hypothetical protein
LDAEVKDPFRSLAELREDTVRRLSGTESMAPLPTSRAEGPGFGDAVGSSYDLSPTPRLFRRTGLIDNIGEGLAVMLPEWAGGITVDEYDQALPSGPPEPFLFDDYVKRLQPRSQDVAIRLYESGEIDDDMDRRQVDAILTDSLSVQDDLETLAAYNENEGFLKTLGASALGGAGDPVYMIPVGGQAARGAMLLRSTPGMLLRLGGTSALTMGALNLASKKVIDQASYDLTNEPGMGDEIVVASIGGGIGLAMPAAAYTAKTALASAINGLSSGGARLPFGLPAWAQRWNSQERLRAAFRQMNLDETDRIVQSVSGEGADAALRRAGGTIRFDQERARSVTILKRLIADARGGTFHPDLSIAPLLAGDDAEIAALTTKLRNLYKRERAAIKTLNLNAMAAGAAPVADPDAFRFAMQRHPAQGAYDDLRIVRAFFDNDPEMQSSPSRNPILSLFLGAGDALPTGTSPGVRMSRWGNLMYDITRALSGSFTDMTPGQLKLLGGSRASAEATKDAFDLMLNGVTVQMRRILKKHKMLGKIRSRIPEGNATMREAVDILFDDQNAAMGMAGAVSQRNPAAVELADTMRNGYFRRIMGELVDVGLFDANPFGMQHYVPLAVDEQAARADKPGFIKAAIAQFRFLDAAERPNQIRPDALARAFDRTTDKAIRDEIVGAVRTHVGDPAFAPANGDEIRARLEDPGVSVLPPESALPATARTAYRDSIEAIYAEGAEALQSRITNPFSETKTFESIGSAGRPDSFRTRTFKAVAPELREFLIRDPITLLRRYGAQVHGQIGIARAIKDHPDIFGKLQIRKGRKMRGVENVDDLLEWLKEAGNAFDSRFKGKDAPEFSGAYKAVQGLLLDQQAMIKRLIGQTLYNDNARPAEGTMFLTRNLSRGAMLVNGGMMGVSNLGDLAMKLGWTAMHPIRGTQILFETFAPFVGSLRRRDLEFLNMMSHLSALPRDTTDFVMAQRGFGTGLTRYASGRADDLMEGAGRGFARAIGLDMVVRMNNKWGAVIATDEMVNLSKRLLLAIDSGAADPIKAARLSETQVALLARLGIRTGNVRAVLEQVHRHGVHWDNGRASAVGFDEFLRSDRPVNPLFDLWDGAKDMRRTFMDTIPNEARRVLNVTPGVADRPVAEETNQVLRLMNQFSSYARAYSLQRGRRIAQMPINEQTAMLATQVMLGWILYATKNDLTMRKPFRESVVELVENPKAAIWGAAQDSMVLGSIMRPLGYADSFGIGPSRWMGQTVAGGTFGAVARQRSDRGVSGAEAAVSVLGPGPQLGIKLWDAMNLPDSPRQDYIAAQVSPLQNFVWSRVLNRIGVSEKVYDRIGYVPGIVPSDVLRPQRPTLRAR